MDKVFKFLLIVFIPLLGVSCFKETSVPVVSDFDIEIINNDYSVPVTIRVANKSVGADLYEWTFEGGEPENSNKIHPDEVVYQNAGTHKIRLEAWNTTERNMKELELYFDSAIDVRFAYTVAINNYPPVEVRFHNYSYGGSEYRWEFGGGEPSVSVNRHPPLVVFKEPGSHLVSLKVSNTRETIEFIDTIHVLPELFVDFVWEPGKDDYDMEAPFMAFLKERCTGVESYRWMIEGGQVEADSLPETTVFFENAGSYKIRLYASNGKEMKYTDKEIVVLENSNLYVVENLKFGITTALEDIGGYYSSIDRNVLKVGDLTEENGSAVDIVFWGLQDFEQCCFLSPDAAELKALPEVPQAKRTWVINRPEFYKVADFDAMKDDEALKSLSIEALSDQGVNICFTKEEIPHCVLFETWDHRKGAIKIKGVMDAGKASYVVADLKIQKEKR